MSFCGWGAVKKIQTLHSLLESARTPWEDLDSWLMMVKTNHPPNVLDSSTCASISLCPRNKQAKILWHIPVPDSFPVLAHTLLYLMSWQPSPNVVPLHLHVQLTRGSEIKCGPALLNLKSTVLHHILLSIVMETQNGWVPFLIQGWVLFQIILNDEMLKLCLWEWINNNKTVYTFPNREWVQAKTRGWDADSEPMEHYLFQNI